jgi:hypothetical protein
MSAEITKGTPLAGESADAGLLSQEFSNRINNLGRVTSVISLLLMVSVPAVITMAHGISVNVWETAVIASGLIMTFAPMAIVENISYYPIIGAGGVYLSCITGNIMNMKLPSALSGMKLAGVEPGSEKGDVISILSIAISSFTTVSILAISMFVIGAFITPYLSHPVLKPAFDNIMPALLGALVTPFVIKNPKIAITPFALAVTLCLCFGYKTVQRYQSYFLPVVMIASVLAAYWMYKMKYIGGERNDKK